MHRRLLYIIILVLHICGEADGQEQNTKRDSLKTERDSVKIEHDSLQIERDSINYKAIEAYSKKSKLTRFFHGLIFKPVEKKTNPPTARSRVKKIIRYPRAEGKVIRNILISTFDPFGFNIQDTSIHPGSFPTRAGNNLHIKSQPGLIKNLLLFKESEIYDSLLINESMRLIRSQRYIRDVFLYSIPTSKKADSVDVYIRVSDIWSVLPAFSISPSTMKIGLTDINFAGTGSTLHGDLVQNRYENYSVARFSYLIPNIRRTFISLNIQNLFPGKHDMIEKYDFTRSYYSPSTSNLSYLFSDNTDLLRSFALERPFYTPLVKWAGGLFLGQIVIPMSYILADSTRYLASRSNIQDYWAARSWQIFKGFRADNRITSFVISGRLLITRYPGRSPEAVNVNVFDNENSFFAGIGINSRKYIQGMYIFNFGKVEDIPVGRAVGITTGFNEKETNRIYLGFNASWGEYYKFGYMSSHLEYGTFKSPTGFQQGAMTARINYFTRLLTIGNWKLRQFASPSLILGIKRLPSDNLTFREGMKGFEDLEYAGSRMMVLTLQTQSYPPWNFWGFNVGPYFYSSLGMLGNEDSGFKNSRLYSLFGVGVLIKNNYLTFNMFQVSMTFYPFVPGNGYNVFRANVYRTSDYGFRNFEVHKPGIVNYR